MRTEFNITSTSREMRFPREKKNKQVVTTYDEVQTDNTIELICAKLCDTQQQNQQGKRCTSVTQLRQSGNTCHR